jgi:hypothetical protein
MLQLLVTANVVPRSLILFTLMMRVVLSSEMSILKTATLCHIPEDGILQVYTTSVLGDGSYDREYVGNVVLCWVHVKVI